MRKTLYEAPETLILKIKIKGTLLQNSVTSVPSMSGKNGYWDEDDEYDY